MWDQFRKALPTVAAACSATKTWGSALLDGESFANASKAAEKKYNNALQSNRLKIAINKGVDKAQEVVQGIADELGFGEKLQSATKKAAPKKKAPAESSDIKKPKVVPKKKAADKKTVAKKAKTPVKKAAVAKKSAVKSVAKITTSAVKKVAKEAKPLADKVKAAPKKKAPAKTAKKK